MGCQVLHPRQRLAKGAGQTGRAIPMIISKLLCIASGNVLDCCQTPQAHKYICLRASFHPLPAIPLKESSERHVIFSFTSRCPKTGSIGTRGSIPTWDEARTVVSRDDMIIKLCIRILPPFDDCANLFRPVLLQLFIKVQ
jgi:hypothetical protein